jgi:hypothetical protein
LLEELLSNRCHLKTTVGRKTGFLLMEKMEFGKQAQGLAKAAIRMLFAYKGTLK